MRQADGWSAGLAGAVNFFNPSGSCSAATWPHAHEQFFAGVREVVYRRSTALATQHLELARQPARRHRRGDRRRGDRRRADPVPPRHRRRSGRAGPYPDRRGHGMSDGVSEHGKVPERPSAAGGAGPGQGLPRRPGPRRGRLRRRPGKVHCWGARTAAGKSTLIKCIAGLVTPDRRRGRRREAPLHDGLRAAAPWYRAWHHLPGARPGTPPERCRQETCSSGHELHGDRCSTGPPCAGRHRRARPPRPRDRHGAFGPRTWWRPPPAAKQIVSIARPSRARPAADHDEPSAGAGPARSRRVRGDPPAHRRGRRRGLHLDRLERSPPSRRDDLRATVARWSSDLGPDTPRPS